MANTPTAVLLNPVESTVLVAASGTRFRIDNRTIEPLYVRLAAAAASPNAGDYDIKIPRGLQYFSDYSEYSGEIRAWSECGGVISISVDA